jgi:hypothetical protein
MLRVTAVAFAGVLLAGCGGEDSAQRDERTVIQEEDQQRAEDAVLRLSDLPTGFEWTSTPSEEDDDGDDVDCLEDIEYDFSDLTVTGDADSDDFETDVLQVSSDVTVYQEVEQAQAALERVMAIAGGEELVGCLEDAMEEAAAEESETTIEFGDVSGGEVSYPEVGEQTEAVEFEIPFEVEGLAASAFMEIVAIREERAVGGIFLFSFGEPFPPTESERLARVLAGRLAP